MNITNPPLLSIPFRPFFILTAIIATLCPPIFITSFLQGSDWTGQLLSLLDWHAHEMIFGFTTALLAGFTLTASSNWTGKKPFQGLALLILCLLWVIERLVLTYNIFPPLPTLIISMSFMMLFYLYLAIMLVDNERNRKILLPLLLLFVMGKAFFLTGGYVGDSDKMFIGKILGINCIKIFLILFSGRLIPFFINSFFKNNDITRIPWIEKSIFPLLIFQLVTQLMNFGDHTAFHLSNMALAILLIVRTWSFTSRSALKNPMLSSLLLAHFWLAIHFTLESIGYFYDDILIGQSGLHALLVGALGTFCVSLMSRVSLGHTGRKIKSSILINGMLISITIAAITRVFSPIIEQDFPTNLLYISTGFWVLAFGLYLVKFIPILIAPRYDA